MTQPEAHVIWFTGISGAGKSTLVGLLEQEFLRRQMPVTVLDGDVVRSFFENDLGYSRPERILNVKRIAFAAKLLADVGQNVLVANIAPYYEVRDFIRRKIPRYVQIFVDASVETVTKRDVKGLYRQYREGKISEIVGVDDGYDRPRSPNLTIATDRETPEQSMEKILALLSDRGIFHE